MRGILYLGPSAAANTVQQRISIALPTGSCTVRRHAQMVKAAWGERCMCASQILA